MLLEAGAKVGAKDSVGCAAGCTLDVQPASEV